MSLCHPSQEYCIRHVFWQYSALSPSWQPWHRQPGFNTSLTCCTMGCLPTSSWSLRKGFTPHSADSARAIDAQDLTSTLVSAHQWRASPGSAALEVFCHISSGAPPSKGWDTHLEEVALAAARKQLNINPSLGLVPMETQGILPQTSPVGRNTPLKKESQVLHGALLIPCPISSQTHLLLFSVPVSGQKNVKWQDF